VRKCCLQFVAFAGFAAVIAYLSATPLYRQWEDGQAVLKLSFSHSAQLKFPCTTRPAQELAKLAPNMRNPVNCPRERSAVRVKLVMDGQLLYQATAQPQGLHKDGATSVYQRISIPAGTHQFDAILSEGDNSKLTYSGTSRASPAAGQVMVIDFQKDKGGFVFTGG